MNARKPGGVPPAKAAMMARKPNGVSPAKAAMMARKPDGVPPPKAAMMTPALLQRGISYLGTKPSHRTCHPVFGKPSQAAAIKPVAIRRPPLPGR